MAVIWPIDLGELRVGFYTTALAGFLYVFSTGLFPPDFTSKLSIHKSESSTTNTTSVLRLFQVDKDFLSFEMMKYFKLFIINSITK